MAFAIRRRQQPATAEPTTDEGAIRSNETADGVDRSRVDQTTDGVDRSRVDQTTGGVDRSPSDATTTTGGTGRSRLAAARGAWAVGSFMALIARLVRLIAGLVALVLVVAIVLVVVKANGSNTVVSDIHDAGRWLAGPFKGMFTIHGHARGTLALNWGIAALVYLIVGSLIARLIMRAAPTGLSPATIRSRRQRGVPPAAPVA